MRSPGHWRTKHVLLSWWFRKKLQRQWNGFQRKRRRPQAKSQQQTATEQQDSPCAEPGPSVSPRDPSEKWLMSKKLLVRGVREVCIICCTAKARMRYACGHMLLCRPCDVKAFRLAAKEGKLEKCPVCTRPIQARFDTMRRIPRVPKVKFDAGSDQEWFDQFFPSSSSEAPTEPWNSDDEVIAEENARRECESKKKQARQEVHSPLPARICPS
jgi:hypothetical protein